jgi:hypothetical protein
MSPFLFIIIYNYTVHTKTIIKVHQNLVHRFILLAVQYFKDGVENMIFLLLKSDRYMSMGVVIISRIIINQCITWVSSNRGSSFVDRLSNPSLELRRFILSTAEDSPKQKTRSARMKMWLIWPTSCSKYVSTNLKLRIRSTRTKITGIEEPKQL